MEGSGAEGATSSPTSTLDLCTLVLLLGTYYFANWILSVETRSAWVGSYPDVTGRRRERWVPSLPWGRAGRPTSVPGCAGLAPVRISAPLYIDMAHTRPFCHRGTRMHAITLTESWCAVSRPARTQAQAAAFPAPGCREWP